MGFYFYKLFQSMAVIFVDFDTHESRIKIHLDYRALHPSNGRVPSFIEDASHSIACGH